MEFEDKVLTIYQGLISCLDPENENLTPISVRDVDEDFFAGSVYALFLLYQKITMDKSLDILDFIATLNKCLVQKLLETNAKMED